jgi:hypothetical protein
LIEGQDRPLLTHARPVAHHASPFAVGRTPTRLEESKEFAASMRP